MSILDGAKLLEDGDAADPFAGATLLEDGDQPAPQQQLTPEAANTIANMVAAGATPEYARQRYYESAANPTAREHAIEQSRAADPGINPINALVKGAIKSAGPLVGAFSPETRDIGDQVLEERYPTSPGAIASTLETVGAVAPDLPALGAGPLGRAYFAAKGAVAGVGNARTEAMHARELGRQVSGAQEGTAAAMYGGVGAAANLIGPGGIGPRIFGETVNRAGRGVVDRFVRSGAENLAASVGQNVAENVIAGQTGIDPERGVFDNTKQAAGSALVTAGIMHGVGELGRAVGQPRQTAPEARRATETPATDPLGVERGGPAESQPQPQPFVPTEAQNRLPDGPIQPVPLPERQTPYQPKPGPARESNAPRPELQQPQPQKGVPDVQEKGQAAPEVLEATQPPVEASAPAAGAFDQAEAETRYPRAAGTVDGRTVGSEIPNQSSIGSSIDNPVELPGIREVQISSFEDNGPPKFYSASEEARTKDLAEQIKASGRIDPLIVVDDGEASPYILEGGHRFDALKLLGAKSFPAKVVLDGDSASATLPPVQQPEPGPVAQRTPGEGTQRPGGKEPAAPQGDSTATMWRESKSFRESMQRALRPRVTKENVSDDAYLNFKVAKDPNKKYVLEQKFGTSDMTELYAYRSPNRPAHQLVGTMDIEPGVKGVAIDGESKGPLDTFIITNKPLSPDRISKWELTTIPGTLSHIALSEQITTSLHGDAGPAHFERIHDDDRQRGAIVLPDASDKGKWRASMYDEGGFYTHTSHPSRQGAIAEAIGQGFSPTHENWLDRFARGEKWKQGVAAVKFRNADNKLLNDPEKRKQLWTIRAEQGDAAALKWFAEQQRPAAPRAAEQPSANTNPFDTGKTSRALTELDKTKPRSVKQTYGANATQEQIASQQAKIRKWNSERAKALKAHREMVAKSNEWMRQPSETAEQPPAPQRAKQPWEMTREEFGKAPGLPPEITSNPDYKEALQRLRKLNEQSLKFAGKETKAAQRWNEARDKASDTLSIVVDGLYNYIHRAAVEQAIREGKITSHPDYPDLAAKPEGATEKIDVTKLKYKELIELANARGVSTQGLKGNKRAKMIERLGGPKAEPVKPISPDTPVGITKRRGELVAQLRDQIIEEHGQKAKDIDERHPLYIQALRGEVRKGSIISEEKAREMAAELPEDHPARFTLYNLEQLEKNPRGTKLVRANSNDVQDGTRVVINDGETVTIDKENMMLEDGIRANIPEEGIDVVGKKILPPLEADVSGDFVPPEAEPPSAVKTDLFGKPFIESSGVGEQQPMFHEPNAAPPVAREQIKASKSAVDPKNTGEMFAAKKPPLPQGATEISQQQALSLHGGRKNLLPKPGEQHNQPSDTTREYFVGQTDDGRFYTLRKPAPTDTPGGGRGTKRHGVVRFGDASPREQFADPEVEARYRAAEGINRPSIVERMTEGAKALVHSFTRNRVFLDTSKKADANMDNIMRIRDAEHQAAPGAAQKMIESYVRDLDRTEYDRFGRSLVLPDILKDIDVGRYEGKDLPFGFKSRQHVEAELARLQRSETSRLQKALEKRRAEQRALTKELVDLDLLPSEVLNDERYYHRQVMEYMAQREGMGIGGSGVKYSKRGFQKQRVGGGDFNTRYEQAEHEYLTHALRQIATKRALNRIKAEFDIAPEVRSQAKEHNLEVAFGGKDNLARFRELTDQIKSLQESPDAKESDVRMQLKALHEERNPLWVTKAEDTNIARAIDNFEQTVMGRRKVGTEDGGQPIYEFDDDPFDGGDDFPHIKLANKIINDVTGEYGEQGQKAARWLMKAISDKRAKVRELAGKQYKTWQDMVPDDHVAWSPKAGTQFAAVQTIPESIVSQVLAGNRDLMESDVRQMFARVPGEQYVIPEHFAQQLDHAPAKEGGALAHINSSLLASWKQWTLLSPLRALKYNLNNMSGDLDVSLAADAKILFGLRRAMSDLRGYANEKAPASIKSEIETAIRLGVIDSGANLHDIPDISDTGVFRNLTRGSANPVKWYWEKVRGGTTLRENLARLSAFRRAKELIKAGKEPLWASKPSELSAITDVNERAAKLSRDLLGDYGNISEAGQVVRRRYIPFWSWMEINAPRYVRLFRNASTTGGKGRVLGAAGMRAGARVGALTARAAAMYALVHLFNRAMFPNEDDGFEDGRLRLLVGRKSDGTVLGVRFQGALSDALSWLDLDQLPGNVAKYRRGEVEMKDIGVSAAKAPVNKLVNAALPLQKTGFEVATGKSLFPDVFNPRQIRDRGEHVARLFGLDTPYRWLKNIPQHDGISSLLLQQNDPKEAAYNDIRGEKYRWLEKQGKATGGGEPTDRSNALYYFKKSNAINRRDLAAYWWKQYIQYGGSVKGKKQSEAMAHPLFGIPQGRRSEFLKSLSTEQRAKLSKAIEWYNRLYRPASTSPD